MGCKAVGRVGDWNSGGKRSREKIGRGEGAGEQGEMGEEVKKNVPEKEKERNKLSYIRRQRSAD